MNDGDFTMIVVGDTQSLNNKYNKYVSSRKNADGEDYFTGLYSWIVKNKENLNVQMVLGLGDIVEDRAKDTNEWLAAVDNFDMLKANEVPFVTIMGDHDTVNIGVRETDLYNSYFSQSYFEDVAEVSGLVGFFEEGHSENAYYVKKIGNIEYLIFGIECEPRKSVIAWMDEIIAENQDKRVIITTHKYLSINGELGTSYYNTSEENALPQYVWDNLLDKYANIDMILGGHYSYADVVTRKTTNSLGTDVYQMLFDPQEIDNDGNPAGAVGILKFSADGNTVDVRWYSTVEDVLIGEDNQTTITLNAKTEEVLIGDITADGRVNAEDLSILRIKLLTNNEYDALYDVNEDGYFNIKDLVRLKKICVKGILTEGISVTEGEVTINEMVDIGKVTVDSDAVVASGTAVVTIDGGSYNGGSGASNTAVWAKENATVIINDGNFYVGADANGDYNDLIYARDNAKIEIYGGFFESEVPWSHNGKYYVLNVRNDSNAIITVYGGTFVNYNPADGDDAVEGAITVADGYTVISEKKSNGDIWYTVSKAE